MAPGKVNINGTWKDVAEVSAKVNGAWKTVTEGYNKVNGTWQQWFASSQPAYELITTVLADGTSTSIAIANIPQDYEHLELVYGTISPSFSQGINIEINNITSNIYDRHFWTIQDGSGSDFQSDNRESFRDFASSSQTLINAGRLLITNYTDANYRLIPLSVMGVNQGQILRRYSTGVMENNGLAVNRIEFIHSSNQPFGATSYFSLYGVRAG